MHPTLESGVFVLVWRSSYLVNGVTPKLAAMLANNKVIHRVVRLPFIHYQMKPRLTLQKGDIVAVRHPRYGYIIKRVTTLEYGDSELYGKRSQQLTRFRLAGDNDCASVSEAEIGWVQAKDLLGKVIYVFK